MPLSGIDTLLTLWRSLLPLVVLTSLFSGCSQQTSQRPDPEGLLFDTAGIVEEKEKLERILVDFRDRFGIELIIATGSGPAFEDINMHAHSLFSAWRVGADYRGRGLLLVVDAERGVGRLEVSYNLEHVLTDYLCGRIIRNQVRPFWEMDMVYVGMLDAVFQISERSKLLKFEKTIAATKAREKDRYLSGGGGVRSPIDFGAGREPKKRLPEPERESYGPGATPSAVVSRFAEAMARGINDNTLEMFTPATQVFFAMEPTLTREYRTYADIIASGGPYEVNSDGSRAVVLLQADVVKRMPIFCRNSPFGWQIDWVTLFHSHGKSLEGEWIMHRVPVGYEHLIEGVDKVRRWATRLPVEVDASIDFRTQVAQAERLLENNPQAPEPYVQLANLYLSCWRWPDALKLYSQAVALAPQDPTYLVCLAEAKYYLYFLESAQKNYRQLRTNPRWRSLSAKRLEQIKRLLSG